MPNPLLPLIALAGGAFAAKKIADNMQEDNLPMDEKAVDIALWGATEKLGRRKQPLFSIVFTSIVQLPFIPTTPNAPKMFTKIADLHGKGEDIATLMKQSLRCSSERYNSVDSDSPAFLTSTPYGAHKMALANKLTNKKKLRRIARQTSGMAGRTVLTLMVAGALASPVVSPLVSQANAAVTEWDGTDLANTDVIKYITEGKTVNISGAVTVTGGVHGANSAEDFANNIYTGRLTMGSGSLTISSIMDGGPSTITTGQIQVKDIQISGGTLTIGGVTGGTPAKWSDGPMLKGGLGGGKTYIDNTTVVLNDYAQLVQGAHNPASNSTDFTTLGTTFTFNGSSAAAASILRMEGTGQNAAIFHIAKDSEVYVPTTKFGRIVGEDLSISGALLSLADGSAMLMSQGIEANGDLKGNFAGSNTPELEIYNTSFSVYKFNSNGAPNMPLGALHVEGTLKVGADAGSRGSLRIGEGGTALIEKSGTVELKGGTLNISQGGKMLLTDVDVDHSDKGNILAAVNTNNTHALKIAGGTLTATTGSVPGDLSNVWVYVEGSTLITGGTGAGTMDVSYGRYVLNGDVQVTGLANAAATLAVKNYTGLQSNNVTLAGAANGLGTLSVQGAGTAETPQSAIIIMGNLDIKAYGKAHSLSHGFLRVAGNSNLAANGAVDVATNGFFVVNGNMTAAAGSTITNAGVFEIVGNFVNKGATINNTATMYVSDTFTTPSSNGAYTHGSAYSQFGVLHLTDMNNGAPVLNVSDGMLHMTAMGATMSPTKQFFTYDSTTSTTAPVMNVSGTGKLFFGGEVGGTFDSAINLTGGSFGVGVGEWTVGNITATAGAVQAGYKPDGSTPSYGTLNVGDLSVTNTATLALRTGKINVSGKFASAANAITLHGGTMTVDWSKVYDSTQSNFLNASVGTIKATGGVLNIKNGGTMSFNDAQKLHDALVGANGLWAGVTVNGIEPETKPLADGKQVDIITADKAAVAGVDTLTKYAVGTAMSNPTSATLGAAAGQIALTGTAATGNVTLTTLDVTTIVGNGKAGDALVLGAGEHKTNVTVADSGTLNLGAAGATGGGTLTGGITNSSAKPATINVASGEFTVKGDVSLTTGSATGTLNLNENGKLAVQGNVAASELVFAAGSLSSTGNVSTGKLTLAGGGLEANGTDKTVTATAEMSVVSGSKVEATKLVLATEDTTHSIDSGSTVDVKTLSVATGSTLVIGSAATDGGKGVLIADSAELSGVEVFLDPAWKGNDLITDASQAAIGGSNIDGLFTVGQNSWVTFGSTDVNWLPTAFADGKLTWGRDYVTAALGIYSPQTLRGGGVLVNGTLTSLGSGKAVANQADFTANSLLAVNAKGLENKAALTGTGTASVADSAKLLLVDGATDQTYTILSGFSGVTLDRGWQGENLLSSSYLQTLALDKSSVGKITVTVDQMAAENVVPKISGSMGNLLDEFEKLGLRNAQSDNVGIAFLSRTTDREFISLDDSARVLESAAQTALAGGAPLASFDSIAVASGAIGERTGMSAPTSTASYSSGDSGYSFGVWGMPLFRSSEISNQTSGAFKYSVDNKLYGGIIGFDVTNQLASGDVRLGAALNIGTGDSKSRGGLSKTKNDYDFWGASLYAGYRLNDFGLSADFGFGSTVSDIRQDIPNSLNMGGQLTSKVDAQSYSLGLKAEYTFHTSVMDITPYVGARYIGYRQDSYNVNSQRGTVFHMASASMNTFTFPIGVRLSRTFEANGWHVSPELNLALVPAAGDTKLASKASIPGVNLTPVSMTGHVFDGFTGEAGLGLRIAKDNVSFGLNYDFQGGSHQRAHSVSGSFRYTF